MGENRITGVLPRQEYQLSSGCDGRNDYFFNLTLNYVECGNGYRIEAIFKQACLSVVFK